MKYWSKLAPKCILLQFRFCDKTKMVFDSADPGASYGDITIPPQTPYFISKTGAISGFATEYRISTN